VDHVQAEHYQDSTTQQRLVKVILPRRALIMTQTAYYTAVLPLACVNFRSPAADPRREGNRKKCDTILCLDISAIASIPLLFQFRVAPRDWHLPYQ
jgi:hypothetical protein